MKEHLAVSGSEVEQIGEFEWAPADIPLLNDVAKYFHSANTVD